MVQSPQEKIVNCKNQQGVALCGTFRDAGGKVIVDSALFISRLRKVLLQTSGKFAIA